MQQTCKAIREADLVTLGPGSLFTSVIPNLLVKGIPEAIRRSGAVSAYVVNLMWQPGETMHYTAADHVRTLLRHADVPLDYVLVNTQPIGAHLRRKYAEREARPVENDLDALHKLGAGVVSGDFVAEAETIRHDPAALARVVIELAAEGRRRRLSGRKRV